MTYGFWRVGQGIREHKYANAVEIGHFDVLTYGGKVLTNNSELAREKMWARIHLIPALQAEEDRDQVRRHLADKAREKELLGTETKVYNSDRYVFQDMASQNTLANHPMTDSFDLPLQSHPNTRRNRAAYCVGLVHTDSEIVGKTRLKMLMFKEPLFSNEIFICV